MSLWVKKQIKQMYMTDMNQLWLCLVRFSFVQIWIEYFGQNIKFHQFCMCLPNIIVDDLFTLSLHLLAVYRRCEINVCLSSLELALM